MNSYSAIIFDFDGTLFDTRQAIAATVHETFVAHDVSPPSLSEVESLIRRGINLEETFTQLLAHSVAAAELGEWVTTYRRIYNSGTGIRASTPFPGSYDALVALHAARVPVVIASNKGEASVNQILSHFGMRDLIQLVIAARDASPTKPDPRSYYDRIVPALGPAACERVLVAGDTDIDIRYARSIGATACWAAYGYGNADVCRELQPDIVAASPQQIAATVCASASG